MVNNRLLVLGVFVAGKDEVDIIVVSDDRVEDPQRDFEQLPASDSGALADERLRGISRAEHHG